MTALIILNEHSCRGRENCAAIESAAVRAGASVVFSRSRDDVEKLATQATAEGVSRIVVVGGDGTVNGALNGVLSSDTPVGRRPEIALVPCGTGNDFARSIGVEFDNDWGRMLESALETEAQSCDVLKVEPEGGAPRFAINACSGGFSTAVGEQITEDDKQMLGSLSYWVAGARELFRLKPYAMELDIDGNVAQIEAYQAVIANGRFIGGGFRVSSDAFVNDGSLDLIVAPVQSSLEILLSLTAVQFGLHADSENIVIRKGERVRIRTDPAMGWSVDGEQFDKTPAITVAVLAGAVRVAASNQSLAFAHRPTRGDKSV